MGQGRERGQSPLSRSWDSERLSCRFCTGALLACMCTCGTGSSGPHRHPPRLSAPPTTEIKAEYLSRATCCPHSGDDDGSGAANPGDRFSIQTSDASRHPATSSSRAAIGAAPCIAAERRRNCKYDHRNDRDRMQSHGVSETKLELAKAKPSKLGSSVRWVIQYKRDGDSRTCCRL